MKKILLLFLLAVYTIIIAGNNTIVEIPYSSIRIRVIANSNSSLDQNNKITIKSALNEYLKSYINNKHYSEIDEFLSNNANINNILNQILKNSNLNLKYSNNYGYNYFPEKTYKGITYAAGNYKSLVITLGEGNGDNWWCVLYPPICQVDENINNYQYKSLVKEIINNYK